MKTSSAERESIDKDSRVDSISGTHRVARMETSLRHGMRDAFAQLDHEPLRNMLLESLELEQGAMRTIHDSFAAFLRSKHAPEVRRRFFSSWQRTNNSAMSVEGLANRITLEAEAVANSDPARALLMFRGGGRLNRVADEDLGVGGQVLHFELYYRMATALTDGDDVWQSREYCLASAAEFKTWLDSIRLRDPVISGLYSLLIHEGYTHAELELIAPMFDRWATEVMGLSPRDARRVLAWISVHIGGTEKAHFAHSCASLSHYCAGSGARIDLEAASNVFRTYLRKKAQVMEQLHDLY
ncbi:MAG TPA: hypothetical protein VK524_17045 [Polyangiaceae bacterium]|nr:hypothetical protein [Polyangiaceae bacterium]